MSEPRRPSPLPNEHFDRMFRRRARIGILLVVALSYAGYRFFKAGAFHPQPVQVGHKFTDANDRPKAAPSPIGACQQFGKVEGAFEAKAAEWNRLLKGINKALPVAGQIESIRKTFGFPVFFAVDERNRSELVPADRVIVRAACGASGLSFVTALPPGNKVLEELRAGREALSPVVEMKGDQITRVWPIPHDSQPRAITGDWLLVDEDVGTFCENCSGPASCPQYKLTLAVTPAGQMAILDPLAETTPDVAKTACPSSPPLGQRQVNCLSLPELSGAGAGSSAGRHTIVAQQPCS